MKKRGFTLIEFISVAVISSILVLVLIQLVTNIIKKVKNASSKKCIDEYGKSIELAIVSYLLDNGDFPEDVSELSIEYTGNKVVCSTVNLNSDSTVYLSGCSVGGVNVDGYSYGKKEKKSASSSYKIGDVVIYNNVNYYVLKDSDISEQIVTLLKAEPLSVDEVNQYGGGHLNRYTDYSVESAYNLNDYGGMAYYSSETCGYVIDNWVNTRCAIDYIESDVKYVVDAWKSAQAPDAIEARLITLDDLTDNLGMEFTTLNETTMRVVETEETPSWIFGTNYGYWTSTTNADKTNQVWYVSTDGNISSYGVHGSREYHLRVVRPVIIIQKSALSN